MRDPPPPHPFPIEPELGDEKVESAPDSLLRALALQLPAAVAEERSGIEFALPDEGLRVDREPAPFQVSENVSAMEVLVQDNGLSFLAPQLAAGRDCLVQ